MKGKPMADQKSSFDIAERSPVCTQALGLRMHGDAGVFPLRFCVAERPTIARPHR